MGTGKGIDIQLFFVFSSFIKEDKGEYKRKKIDNKKIGIFISVFPLAQMHMQAEWLVG